MAELKLGKKTTALYAEAKTLHGKLDRYAYGPPPVRHGEAELDQARAAGVLLELDRTQVILDRGVYRELVETAVARTIVDLRARAAERATEQHERKAASTGKRSAPTNRTGLQSLSQRAVAEVYDAVSESALIEEFEVGARIGRQRRLAATEDHGPDEQLALVKQPGLEGLCREVRTSDGEVAAGRGLQFAYRGGVEVAFEPGVGG